MRIYATLADYQTWLEDTPPAGSSRALRMASTVVDEMLRAAAYATDTLGMPTDATVIAALRDATCAQAEYARASGDAASVGAGAVSAFTIGGVSVTKGQPGQPAGSSQAPTLPAAWAPMAWRLLHDVPVAVLSWELVTY